MLSLVIPVYNEHESLIRLHEEICAAVEPLGQPYEIIFVDDGSRDGSAMVLRQLHTGDEAVRVITFRRNFGKSAALAAGFAHVRGDIVITLDSDLQDNPAEIPRMLEKLEEGFDLVSGWKYPRYDPPTKTLPSRLFNAVTAQMVGLRLHDFNCGFKCYRRAVVDSVTLYGELHRYIPALAHIQGYRVTEIKVSHRPRQFGRSKFGVERFWNGFIDLVGVLFISRYLQKPLHLFGLIGFLVLALGFAINLYLTVLWLLGQGPIGDRPLLSLGILLMIAGIQILSFGLLAHLQIHNLHVHGAKDQYVIAEVLERH